jgi:hypothetical protein
MQVRGQLDLLVTMLLALRPPEHTTKHIQNTQQSTHRTHNTHRTQKTHRTHKKLSVHPAGDTDVTVN